MPQCHCAITQSRHHPITPCCRGHVTVCRAAAVLDLGTSAGERPTFERPAAPRKRGRPKKVPFVPDSPARSAVRACITEPKIRHSPSGAAHKRDSRLRRTKFLRLWEDGAHQRHPQLRQSHGRCRRSVLRRAPRGVGDRRSSWRRPPRCRPGRRTHEFIEPPSPTFPPSRRTCKLLCVSEPGSDRVCTLGAVNKGCEADVRGGSAAADDLHGGAPRREPADASAAH
jgi:hypothetical protein